ncbi:MAG: SAM-dependent methyltransferase [Actinobacteria bacterium]|nr:SAM-dependent methyltransferase [Actinomycetota bacterium]
MGSIVELIEKRGPITFAEYMGLALYDPHHGYYAHHIPGPDDDYRTSPSLSPWFGRLLVKLFVAMQHAMGGSSEFRVVELGAGSASLAASVLESIDAASSTRWAVVERFKEIATRQREALREHNGVEWAPSLREVSPGDGCIFANEVLDNFPVHLLEVVEGGVAEIYVRATDGSLAEELGPPSDPRLKAHASNAMGHLEIGDRFEVNLAADEFAEDASAVIGRGYLLIIDYGDVEPDLWTRRPAGSLVSYGTDGLHLEVLRQPGRRDITAHVNFSHLGRSLEGLGWNVSPVRTQRQMLIELGAADVEEQLRQAQHSAQEQGLGAEAVRLMAERSALTALYRSGGLGDLRVMIASKNAPAIERL